VTESEAHQKFVDAQLQHIKKMAADYPFIDLSKETEYFEKQVK
jgi:hypothetical protein